MLIEIEGVDGTGKTQLSKALAIRLGADYQKFPDRNTPSGRLIDLALRGRYAIDALPFQALQTCNRLEKLAQLTLAKGSATNHMVCDRYQMSGVVYGISDGLDRVWLAQTILRATPHADIHVLLTCPPDKLDGERLKGKDRETFEMEGINAFQVRQDSYRGLWAASAVSEGIGRWPCFDSFTMSTEEMVEAIYSTFQRLTEVTRG